jgi:hypothetical protein
VAPYFWSSWPETDRTLGEIAMSPFIKRDAALCPQRAHELDSIMMKDIGRKLSDTVGNA